MRDLPFECEILDKEPVEVTNPYSGESIMLKPDAVAVYDAIQGAERTMQDYTQATPDVVYNIFDAGLEWFLKNEPKAYMVLLD